ncbi:ABC transporter permease [Staphylospora marina]|uniref:ABC transporter permease n=1 Tax=Staphylospora marina TaxID=2490858 RepID=UPI000F5BC087|nr:ABC transporter permease [Staphylospora marina]
MKALLAHTRLEVTLLFREVIAVFFSFLLPGASFVIMGKIFGDQVYSTGTYFETYIPSMMGIIIFATCLFAVGLQVVIDREKGVYKRLKGTPINPFHVLVALLAKGFIAIYVGVVEILVLARLVFDVSLTPHLLQFLGAVTWATLSFLGLGFLMVSVTRRMQTALAFGFICMYPMMFLSGSFFPLDMMSDFWKDVAQFNPLFHANQLMILGYKGDLFTQTGAISAAVLGGILVVGSGIGFRYFRWEP